MFNVNVVPRCWPLSTAQGSSILTLEGAHADLCAQAGVTNETCCEFAFGYQP